MLWLSDALDTLIGMVLLTELRGRYSQVRAGIC